MGLVFPSESFSKQRGLIGREVGGGGAVVFPFGTDHIVVADDGTAVVVDDTTVEVYTDAPLAPTLLSATTFDADRIDLAWTNNALDAAGIKIERSLTGVGAWAEIDDIAPTLDTYQDMGLDADTQYFYRIKAYHAYLESEYSNTADDTTDPDVSDTWLIEEGSAHESGKLDGTSVAGQISLSRYDDVGGDRSAFIEAMSLIEVTGTGGTANYEVTSVTPIGGPITHYDLEVTLNSGSFTYTNGQTAHITSV